LNLKRFLLNVSALLGIFLSAPSVLALDVPKLNGYVNDYAQMLSADQAQKLEGDLKENESATSNQIFILTIPSLEGQVLEEFSIKVAEAWKAGQKGKDNGVIVLLAKNDRKIRIEVGRGLEGRLTDLVSGRIIREEMTPRLKANDAFGALEKCVEKINLAVKGEYKGDNATKKESDKEKAKFLIALGIFFVISSIFGFMHVFAGGIAGAVAAPALGFFMYNAGLPMILVLIAVGFLGGFIARFVLEAGLSGGGISGGGGSDGGGIFSGGGGTFGGGGASGSW